MFSGVRPMKRFPVVLGQRMYYLSSEEARSKFLGDPTAYVTQPAPLPHYPLKLAVQGLPKSGKTTGTLSVCMSLVILLPCTTHTYMYVCVYYLQCLFIIKHATMWNKLH